MHKSVIDEDIYILRYLLETNKEMLSNQYDCDGQTPLSLSIREEKYFCSKILITNKVDVNLGGGPLG